MNDSIKKAWAKEYEKKGIPSSFRKDPTQPLIDFISWLNKRGEKLEGFAADIGAGQGRNSLYLASQGFEVIALELVEKNVEIINRQAQIDQLPIHAFAQSVATSWPIASNSLKIAIDIFCYKHIVDKEQQKNYRRQLHKSLRSDGFYLISLASEKDGFYGPLLKSSSKNKLIVDPYSNIASFLYSMDDLKEEFSDLFEAVEMYEQIRSSPMHGKEYSRTILNAILRKK